MKKVCFLFLLFLSQIINSQTNTEYLQSALEKYLKKDLRGAIKDFDKALETGILSDEYAFSAYSYRGNCKNELNDYTGAISDYNEALKFNTSPFNIYGKRAVCKSMLGDNVGAILDLGKEIELNPNDPENYFMRGNEKIRLKDYRGAILDFNKAIELNPKHSGAFLLRGFSNYYLGKKENACLDWSKAGELGNYEAYNLIKQYCN